MVGRSYVDGASLGACGICKMGPESATFHAARWRTWAADGSARRGHVRRVCFGEVRGVPHLSSARSSFVAFGGSSNDYDADPDRSEAIGERDIPTTYCQLVGLDLLSAGV